jgi:outer membrane protein, heavy metal efflux system
MTIRPMSAVVVGGLLLCSVGEAQTQPSPPGAAQYIDSADGLSLAQAIALAMAQEPSLQGARADADVALAMQTQARARPNPMVSFVQQGEPAGMDNQTRIEVVWPLDLFRQTGRAAVAERETAVARLTVADRERLLAADVRAAYGQAARSVRDWLILGEVIQAASRQHELVAARVTQGAGPPLERDILQVELQRLESDRLLLSGDVERRLIELKRVLGLRPDAPLRLRDDLEQLVLRDTGTNALRVTVPDDGALIRERPDVQAAESRVLVAEAQIDRAERDGRLDVNLTGMYMRMDSNFPQAGFAPDGALEPVHGIFHYLAVGASVTVPLRDRKQGEVAAARARRAGAVAERDATELLARTELAVARVRDERARQAIAAYSLDTRTLARRNLAVISQTYELGRGTVIDVLTEQRRYLELERGFTTALAEAYDARQALERALGGVQ